MDFLIVLLNGDLDLSDILGGVIGKTGIDQRDLHRITAAPVSVFSHVVQKLHIIRSSFRMDACKADGQVIPCHQVMLLTMVMVLLL